MKKINLLNSDRKKALFLIGLYIVFTELIKIKAEVYTVEQSFELKLLLFSLAVVLMYGIPYRLIVVSISFLVFLSIFNVQTGLVVYALVVYAFIKMLKSFKRTNSV